MDKLVLFTKSYRGDLQRAIKLSESIQKHNVDKLPYYVSVPKEDLEMFRNALPYYTKVIDDAEITNMNHGWVGQQYVKAMFYKLNLCEYYVCIDSDSYFFKDFETDDFLYNEQTPYMVMHEGTSFFEWCDRYSEEYLGFDPIKSFENEYKEIRKFLNNGGKKIMDHGPSPLIWDTDVWKEADDVFGIDNLFSKCSAEIKWYGELVEYFQFNFVPCGPLFKVFHYKQQYDWYKQLGWNEEDFRKQYLGIVMQSNWGTELIYE